MSQVVSAVGQVETLVAEWKIGYLLVAQRHRQSHPVVKRRVDNFVTQKFSDAVGNGYVANFASPAFGQR